MILLDTNIVVACLNGNELVASKVVENINKIGLSTIVIAELDYGAKASQHNSRNLVVLYRFVKLVRVAGYQKNKLDRRMVDEFMDEKLPRFKTLLPEYRDSKILAGIGALVVKDDVGRSKAKPSILVRPLPSVICHLITPVRRS